VAQKIGELIKQTEEWRLDHLQNGRMIEAAACSVRLKALREAYEIVIRG
jgi:hypothetical protein